MACLAVVFPSFSAGNRLFPAPAVAPGSLMRVNDSFALSLRENLPAFPSFPVQFSVRKTRDQPPHFPILPRRIDFPALTQWSVEIVRPPVPESKRLGEPLPNWRAAPARGCDETGGTNGANRIAALGSTQQAPSVARMSPPAAQLPQRSFERGEKRPLMVECESADFKMGAATRRAGDTSPLRLSAI